MQKDPVLGAEIPHSTSEIMHNSMLTTEDKYPQPPPPVHLFYLPAVILGHRTTAMLDSGAANSFISQSLVERLPLRAMQLKAAETYTAIFFDPD